MSRLPSCAWLLSATLLNSPLSRSAGVRSTEVVVAFCESSSLVSTNGLAPMITEVSCFVSRLSIGLLEATVDYWVLNAISVYPALGDKWHGKGEIRVWVNSRTTCARWSFMLPNRVLPRGELQQLSRPIN